MVDRLEYSTPVSENNLNFRLSITIPVMLTEQDLAIIDKLHHSIMRQIFMYDQLVKKIPGSRVYGLIKRNTGPSGLCFTATNV